MSIELDTLKQQVIGALDDLKAQDVRVVDVRGKTTITDLMIVASGTSDRHVKALADNVIHKAKETGVQPLGVEGNRECEWVLVDLNDIVVHIMLPRTRDFYNLEKLWRMDDRQLSGNSKP